MCQIFLAKLREKLATYGQYTSLLIAPLLLHMFLTITMYLVLFQGAMIFSKSDIKNCPIITDFCTL